MERIALRPAVHEIWEGVLTPREAEVVELVAKGYRDPEIARELHMSVQTAKYHQTNVRAKLDADNRIVLARWWWENVERPGLSEVAPLAEAA